MGAPPPSAAFAGAWSMDPASAFAKHAYVTEFVRVTRDWNNDGRLDEDREAESGVVTFYSTTNGKPHWAAVQREADTTRAQTGVRNFVAREVVHGVCAWCAPNAFQPLRDIGSYQHQFNSTSSATVSANISTTFGLGKPGAEAVSFNPVNQPMTRALSGQFDLGGVIDPPAALIANDPGLDLTSDEVGATDGDFRVDESGAATYNIAIMTVPGAGGFAPQMGLSYSSAAGDGVMGVGWNIAGLSAITRCRRAAEYGDSPNASGIFAPITMQDGQDVFCLDGQRLVQVHSGSETVDGATLNFFEYRNELDNGSRIRGYRSTTLDPLWFAVWGKDGSYREYGRDASSENSRLSANANGTQRVGVTASWAINKLRDAGKNYIRFSYGVDSNNGEQWLLEVRYTGNETTGLTPESAGHKIVFDYTTATPAYDIGYNAGSKSQRTKQLSMVRSLTGATELRRYVPTYFSVDANSNYRRQVQQIKECRLNGSLVCYPPTTFARTLGMSQLGNLYASNVPDVRQMKGQKFGDINGDGRADMVWLKKLGSSYNDFLYVRFTRSLGSSLDFYDDLGTPRHTDFDADRGWHLFDYNADGKDDLLLIEYLNGVNGAAEWRLRYSTGTGFSNTPISLGIPASADNKAVLADMNGDGLPDFVSGGPNNSLQVRYLIKNPVFVDGKPFIFTSPSNVQFVDNNGVAGAYTFRPRKIDQDQFDVFDVNADGRADLVMRSKLATGGTAEYWMIFTSEAITPTTLNFRLYKRWQATEAGAVASDDDDKFRVTDINGDGLADVFYRRANLDKQWVYEINQGSTNLGVGNYTAPACALGGALSSGCNLTLTDRLLKLQDYNGDGRADIWNTSTAPIVAGTDDYAYLAHLWNGTSFAFTGITTGAIAYNRNVSGDSNTPRLSAFPDLDGDGKGDQITTEWASEDGSFRIHRSATPYLPRNLIREITNGFGNKTVIDYAPMTFASVYRRDYGSEYNLTGRGAVVHEVVSATYLVEAIETCAPREGQVDCISPSTGGFSRIEYAYQGAKTQGGGRGFQGFRFLETYDLQRSVLTRTDYAQNFPLTGRAIRTRAWHLSGANRVDMCALPDSATCFQAAYMCRSSKNNQPMPCDLPLYGVMFNINSSSSLGSARNMSESSDSYEWSWLSSAPNGANDNQWSAANTVLPTSMPTSIRVLLIGSTKTSTDPSASGSLPQAEQIIRVDRTAFENGPSAKRYDDYGNPVRVLTDTLDGLGHYTHRTVAENMYANFPNTWQLGRLTSTTTTTTRGATSKVRTSSFEYDPISKLLKVERVMPGTGAQNELNRFYQYDAFGNKIKTATCSVEFNTEALCLSASAASIAAQPTTDTSIRRYTRDVFDSQGRFKDQSIELFFSTAASSREVIVSSASSRNPFGDAQTLTSALGTNTSLRFGHMGSKYFEATNTGAAVTSRYRFCSAVACPQGAKYRVEISTAGAPKRWSYFDALGRDVLSLKEAFETGKYIAVRQHYDFLGRVRKVSEPYFAFGPNSTGVEAASTGSIYWTTTSYDVLDRPISIQHPNNTVTTMSYNVRTTTTTNPKSQTRVEVKNPLGEVIRVTDNLNSSVCFTYDTFGNLQTTGKSSAANCDFVQTTQTLVFDDLGRKISMNDVDMGAWSYSYNAAGELTKQVSPRGQCTINKYDVRGRIFARADYSNAACSTIEHNASWVFDTLKPGLLTSEVAGNSYSGVSTSNQSKILTYDSFGRLQTTTTNVDGQSFSERMTYDQYSRAFQQFDASGEGVLNQYNPRGYLYRVRNAAPGLYGEVYYEIRTMDARDKVTKDWRGVNVQSIAGVADQSFSGLETRRGFDPSTGWLTSLQAGESAFANSYIQNWTYAYDTIGNVEQRHDWRSDGQYHEYAVYDSLNRLDLLSRYQGAALTPRGSEDYTYDAWGNLLNKPGISGAMIYGQTNAACSLRPTAGPNAVTSANGVTYCYDQAGNQVSGSDGRSVLYTVANQVRGISLTATNKSTRYFYGASRSRYKRQDYPSANFFGSPKTTVYVGNVEHITESSGIVEVKRYVAGVAILSRRTDGVDKNDYLFVDHLGSTDVITDRFGNVNQLCVNDDFGYRCRGGQRMSFDAFGMRRKVADNSTTAWTQLDLVSRSGFSISKTTHGFTGHEMADGVDLIHMNGRMYDPELGRFIQADPMIQDPYNTQSLNRYSYVLNNPLTSTDPSGYFSWSETLRVVAAVVITVYTGGLASTAVAAGNVGTAVAISAVGGAASGAIQSGTLKGALIGAFSGVVFSSIGVSDLSYSQRVLAHGVAGGTISVLQGGKFGHGFVSAGLSKAITPSIDTGDVFADGTLLAIAGGTISELTGGKFANGAVTSAMQFAFNQVASGAYARQMQAVNRSATTSSSGSVAQMLRSANARRLIREIQQIEPGFKYEVIGGPHNNRDISALQLALRQRLLWGICPTPATVGDHVYRVYGGISGPFGQSWTRINPESRPDYRNDAGLPNGNTGSFVVQGTLLNTTGVRTRGATPLHGNSGGIDEVIIPNANQKVWIRNVSGVNPEY